MKFAHPDDQGRGSDRVDGVDLDDLCDRLAQKSTGELTAMIESLRREIGRSKGESRRHELTTLMHVALDELQARKIAACLKPRRSP
jgi:hypothetical protein